MDYKIVSFSGGKDSTAMLLRLIELGEDIAEVIYCDVGKEFPTMYRHVEKVKEIVERNKIKFTTLKSEKSFDFYMFDYQPNRKKSDLKNLTGFSWPGPRQRWCTSSLKISIISKHLKELKKRYNVIEYIGIAADEKHRIERENNNRPGKKLPLIEWGWSEIDCLNYCYSLGFNWDGLYEIFKRVSCWCCPLKSLSELRKLRENFPELWEELKYMDSRTWRKFRADYSVLELEERFKFEKEREQKGLSINNREFFLELNKRLINLKNESYAGKGVVI